MNRIYTNHPLNFPEEVLRTPRHVVFLAVVLLAALSALSILDMQGGVPGVLFIIPVLTTFRSPRRSFTITVASCATLLVLGHFWWNSDRSPSGFAEHLDEVIAIWLLAATAMWYTLMENQLDRSLQTFQNVIESSPNIQFVVDLVHGRVLYVSEQIVDLLGLPPKEILDLGDSVAERLVHPDDLLACQEIAKRLQSARDSGIVSFEYRLRNSNGDWQWFLSYARVLRRTAVSAPRYLIGSAMDISSRKQEEQSLNRRNCVLAAIGKCDRIIAQAADEQIMVEDIRRVLAEEAGYPTVRIADEDVTSSNPASSQVVRWPIQRDGQNYGELEVGFQDVTALAEERIWLAELAEAMAQGVHRLRLQKEQARERRKLQEGAGELRHALSDAQREAERQMERLADLSHELRTPMNSLIGHAQLLMDEALSPWQAEFVHTIRDSASAMTELLSGTLEQSTAVSDGKQAIRQPFSLLSVIEGTAMLFAARAREKGITLHCYLDPDLPHDLIGDAGRLRQVLTNLVSNAVKFTDHGEVVMRAMAVESNGEERLVRFVVSDTGVGIPEEHQRTIFERFVQVNGSTVPPEGGCGIGLSICSELVSLMGGHVNVQSAPGRGSVFEVTLPFRKALSSWSEKRRPHLKGLQILAVESSETGRTLLRDTLQAWHCDVTNVTGSRAALELLRDSNASTRPFAWMIAALDIPEANHLFSVKDLLTACAASGSKAVLISPRADRAQVQILQKLGAAEFISRPVRQSRLLEILTRTGEHSDVLQSGTESNNGVSGNSPPSHRVLVVEDNEVNQELMKKFLHRRGFSGDIAVSAGEALSLLSCEDYSLILMDMRLPDMDGCECTQRIRRSSVSQDIPIIAMTGNVLPADRQRCLDAGMNDIITKPIRADELYAKMRRWMALDLEPGGR